MLARADDGSSHVCMMYTKLEWGGQTALMRYVSVVCVADASEGIDGRATRG